MSKAKSKNKEDVMSFLDDLEKEDGSNDQNAPSSTTVEEGDDKEVMDFLDELTTKPSRPETPSVPNKKSNATVGDTKLRDSTTINVEDQEPDPASTPPSSNQQPQSWSLSGWWSQAQQVVSTKLKDTEEGRKFVEEKLRGVKIDEYVKNVDLGSLASTLKIVMNAVAPPIQQHELLKVCIFHDMVGYASAERIVYGVFDRVMSQVEGGQLVVQQGKEGSKSVNSDNAEDKELNICDGIEEAIKLAKANLAPFTKGKQPEESQPASPIHTSNIYLAIQPCSFDDQVPSTTSTSSDGVAIDMAEKSVAFIVHLADPAHELEFTSQSQAFPYEWVEWLRNDDGKNVVNPRDWVEEWLEEGLALAVGLVAQRYVAKRMGVPESFNKNGKVESRKSTEES